MSEHLDDLERERDDWPYPPYVTTQAERKRWDVSEALARELFGDVSEAQVWQATRSLYHGPIKTE